MIRVSAAARALTANGPLPVGIAVGLAASAAWWAARPRRAVVHGSSMTPTLLPGDRLLAVRTLRPTAGRLVLVRDPREPARVIVKRVAAVGPAGVTVLGDHPAASTDSRHFGPVPGRLVLGRVAYRYGPEGRTGPVGRWDRARA